MTETLTAFDLLVLLILVGSFLVALFRGFTTMVLTVAAWIGAILATLYLSPPASRLLAGVVEPAALAGGIAIALVFILSAVGFKMAANLIGRRVRSGPVGLLDRSLGAALGLFLGALLVSTAYLAFASVWPERRHPDWIVEARTRPLVSWGAAMVAKTGPELFADLEETPRGEALIERWRRTYDTGRERTRELGETVYDEAARQLMEQKLEELQKTGGESKPEG